MFLMNLSLTQKRRAFHEKIRIGQIAELFRHQRKVMETPSKNINQSVVDVIRNIKEIVEQQNREDLLYWLRSYRKIAGDHRIGELLFDSLVFCHELPIVKEGVLPVECSLAEFFIFIMNLQQNQASRNEILNIIEVNTYHLRLMAGKHLEEVTQLIKMTIDNLCLSWCQDRNVWSSFLGLLKEILIWVHLIDSESLLRQKSSDLIYYLSLMGRDGQFMKNEVERQKFIEVAIYFLILQQSEHSKQIQYMVEYLIMKTVEENTDNLGRSSEYLRVLLMKGTQLQPQTLTFLEDFCQLAMKNRQFSYFQLINSLLCINNQPVSQEMLFSLLSFVLSQEASKSLTKETLQTKKWMILIMRRHLSFRQDHLSQEELQICLKILEQNIDNFLIVMQEISFLNRQTQPILIYLLTSILTDLDQLNKLSPNLNRMVAILSFRKQSKILPKC